MNALDKLWLEIEALSKRCVPEGMEDEYERGCRETASLFLTMIEEAGGCNPALREYHISCVARIGKS